MVAFRHFFAVRYKCGALIRVAHTHHRTHHTAGITDLGIDERVTEILLEHRQLGSYHRAAACERFQHRQAEPFVVGALDQSRGSPVQPEQTFLLHITKENDPRMHRNIHRVERSAGPTDDQQVVIVALQASEPVEHPVQSFSGIERTDREVIRPWVRRINGRPVPIDVNERGNDGDAVLADPEIALEFAGHVRVRCEHTRGFARHAWHQHPVPCGEAGVEPIRMMDKSQVVYEGYVSIAAQRAGVGR